MIPLRPMKILVTAGNTQTPVDRVRCITNIFTGKTGARIALTAHDRGHEVTLLTSHPEVAASLPAVRPRVSPGWIVRPYRTFDDLDVLLTEEITTGRFDAVIHSAAVSDYRVEGVFANGPGTSPVALTGKVKGSHPELWMKLVPAPKLVDKVRREWEFRGTLVKFKLEVSVSDDELLKIAEKSRVHSGADLMVANTLEKLEWAFIGAREYTRVSRDDLAAAILDQIEARG